MNQVRRNVKYNSISRPSLKERSLVVAVEELEELEGSSSKKGAYRSKNEARCC